MALIGLFGAVLVLTVVWMWVSMRTAFAAFNADSDELRHRLSRYWEAYKLALVVLIIAEFWPGVSHWMNEAWTYVPL